METEFKDVYLILSSRYTAYITQFLLMNKNKVIFDNDKIYEVIYRTFNDIPMSKNLDIESIYEIDNQTRIEAKKVVKSVS